MPLSQTQIAALKCPETTISIQQENPKKPGTKAHERFEKYMGAETIGDAMSKGANWQDLSGDFEKNYLKIPHLMEEDLGESHSVKRAAPEGTPDKEAQNRSKMPSTDMVPRALVPERSDAVTKVEMSAATISALQAMMRTEIQHGLMDMEQRFNNKVDKSVDELRTQFMEELRGEKDAREILERRISDLENRGSTSGQVPPMEFEDVDKSVVVIGGFIEKTIVDVESLMEEMMTGIAGYKDKEIIETTPPIALAHFDSPERAMKFIRSQKKNHTIHANKFWVSENRSKPERLRCKMVSKLKKFLIELDGFAAKDVHASYKVFKVVVKSDGKMLPVAYFNDNGSVQWLEKSVVSEGVREAVEAFIAELE